MKIKAPAFLISFILLLIAFTGYLFSGTGLITYAATSVSSPVLSDLKSDKNFNVNDYPAIGIDYSIKVIQIAESTENELLIYTYQPAAKKIDLRAKSINISREKENTDEKGFKNYWLDYLNSDGVFYKYKVRNLTVSKDSERYYNISNILRQYNEKIDQHPAIGQTVSEVKNKVAQQWTATTAENGETVYAMTDTEVVDITKKDCGFVRYPQGLKYNTAFTSCDGHYVAFTSDHDMDKLLAARVCYVEQSYKKTLLGTSEGEPKQGEKYIAHDQYATADTIIIGKSHKWQRIQTGEEFVKNTPSLSEKDKKELADYQYVLNFYETPYEGSTGALGWFSAGAISPVFLIPGILSLDNCAGTAVTEVMILEMTFEKDGTVYNLGVVDNKQSGERIPSNNVGINKLPAWVTIVIIVGVVVAACAGLVVLSILFPPFAKVMLSILKGLFWLICAPFRLIALIVKAIANAAQKRKEAAPAKATRSKSGGKELNTSRRSTRRSSSRSTKKTRTGSKRK